MKFIFEDLNMDFCPLHSTNAYTCRVTIVLMWRLVQDNVLGFSGMFKDFHVWLQIALRNQMLEKSGFNF